MDFARLSDKIVHDLENKGYELVDRVASIAEELLEGVTAVLEEAAERVSEAKEKAEEKNGTTFAGLWKEFTDTVEPEAPVEQETSLLDRAKTSYEYLKENVPAWDFHKGEDFWNTYYTSGFESETINRLNTLIREADKHKSAQESNVV